MHPNLRDGFQSQLSWLDSPENLAKWNIIRMNVKTRLSMR